jgi:glycosyltransferase involved in cell wall biosynthesis
MAYKKKPKLVLCFIIVGFAGGGAEKQCIHLLNEFQNHPDVEVHLIHFYEGVNFEFLNQENLHRHQLDTNSFYNPVNIFKVLSIVKRIKPDILFTWLQAADVYAYFVRKLYPKVKWVVAERNANFPDDFRFKLRAATGKSADMIVANSGPGKQYWLKKGVDEKKVKVIHNITLKTNPVATDDVKGKPSVLFAGRFEDQKNVLVLTEAFCKLAADYPEGRFYLIGEGSLKPGMEEIIQRHNKERQVLILPFKKNISSYFAAADVFVNISLFEGMPNTVIENVNLKKKIVVSNIKEHRDLLGEDYPFLVNNLNDADEVCLRIKDSLAIADNTVYLQKTRKIVEDMTPENITGQYKDAFLSIL